MRLAGGDAFALKVASDRVEARAEENTARHAGAPDYFVTLLDPHSIRIRADRIAL
jgi:hypothetical protein